MTTTPTDLPRSDAPDRTPSSRHQVPTGDASPADLAAHLARMRAARRGQPSWSCDARLDLLASVEHTLLKRQGDIARVISEDFGGRSRHESLVAEVFVTVQGIRFIRARLREWMEPRERSVAWEFFPGRAEVRYQPLGVVGIIAPWNYPIQLAFAPLAGALAAGNSALLKPSELAPHTANLLRELISESLPSDVATVVTGGSSVGEAFSRLPFDHLVFTGSTRVGRAVMRAASDNLVPVTLELGGKSPALVSEGFPLRTAADRVMTGKLFNAGQTCIAPDYALVPAVDRDRFVSACQSAVGRMYPTLGANPDYTAIINARHHARLVALLDDARSKGATILEINPAGESIDPATRKLLPTLVLDPTEDMAVMQDEIFGPILPVQTYRALDEAIAYVNDHPQPLALYVFSHDEGTVTRVLDETLAGGVTVNDTMLHIAQDDLPFGGVGPSGMGHYHGFEGFEALSKKKPVFRQARINTAGLLRPPFGRVLEGFLKMVLRG